MQNLKFCITGCRKTGCDLQNSWPTQSQVSWVIRQCLTHANGQFGRVETQSKFGDSLERVRKFLASPTGIETKTIQSSFALQRTRGCKTVLGHFARKAQFDAASLQIEMAPRIYYLRKCGCFHLRFGVIIVAFIDIVSTTFFHLAASFRIQAITPRCMYPSKVAVRMESSQLQLMDII